MPRGADCWEYDQVVTENVILLRRADLDQLKSACCPNEWHDVAAVVMGVLET